MSPPHPFTQQRHCPQMPSGSTNTPASDQSNTDTLHRSSSWGRVVAIRLFKCHSESVARWINPMIDSVKLLQVASGSMPFPYVTIAAGITIQVLEIIKVRRFYGKTFVNSYLLGMSNLDSKYKSRRVPRPRRQSCSDDHSNSR